MKTMSSIKSALLSLDGLSVGDAFGAAFGEGVTSPVAALWISGRQLPPRPWQWTDDTHMALSIVENLSEFEEIDQDALAERFTERFAEEPYRGYGQGAAWLLQQLAEGEDWVELAPQLFDGGSYGNGAAMRAAPIGGYYKEQPALAAKAAQRTAVITHAHPEGQAGAIAVAVAAAIAGKTNYPRGHAFLAQVMPFVPDGETRDGIQLSMKIPPSDFDTAVTKLGTGWQVSAQDTVPFCLWCAAYNHDDFAAALWQTAAGAGDRDTTCAIVGGIVALSAGEVPEAWIARREPLPGDFIVAG
jgi:ADP-ribosylglycohydrolase